MTKESEGKEIQSRVLSRKEDEVYQNVTGNEGPSPLMKRYLKLRQKRQLAKSVWGGPGKKR